MFNKYKNLLEALVFCIISFVIIYLLIHSSTITHVESLQNNPKEDIVYHDLVIEERIYNDIEVGDIVRYGDFYDIDNNGEITLQPLNWKAIDVEDSAVLLITCDIIENVQYNAFWDSVHWENSTIRRWLNEYFYNVAFNEYEKRDILYRNVICEKNFVFDTNAGESTKDKVFLLALSDMNKYFKGNDSRRAKGTKYAIEKGLWISNMEISNGYSVWWLRTPGRTDTRASLVHAGGAPGEFGDVVSTMGNGVRPCIWVKTKKRR